MTLFRGDRPGHPGRPLRRRRAPRRRGRRASASRDGVIVARGPFAVVPTVPDEEVVDLDGGVLLPGFVDTHVHYPQVRAIGGLGMPLLDWLEQCALPEEARLADSGYARQVAAEFVSGLACAGTTTALVFGAHFADAVDVLFTEAARSGLRITSGLVVSDRLLRDELLTTPERAYDEGRALARRWHGVGRARYAVIPAFLAVLQRRPSRVVRGPPQGRRRVLVHLAHQRERPRDRNRRRPVRPRALPRHLRPARAGRPPQRPGAQRAPHRRRAARARRARRHGLALPDAATPPSAAASSRWRGTWRTACGSRSAPTSAPAPGSRC